MSNPSKKFLVVIAGPTAVGKTSIAIELAKYFHAEIISADSRQVYKELNIGTAVPSIDELSSIKHHCIQHISIHDDYNVGEYEKDVLEILENIFQNNNIAILCGGTGLYIDAICNGIDEFPPIEKAIKEEVTLICKDKDNALNLLLSLDPIYYHQIDRDNIRRVSRALEVCLQAKNSFSSYLTNQKKIRDFQIIKICLYENREKLYRRINQRVDKMVENGLIDESKSIEKYKNLKALQTVGYSELFDYFEAKSTLEFAIDKIKQHSRNYAKRQITWFNKDNTYKMYLINQIEEMKDLIKKKIND